MCENNKQQFFGFYRGLMDLDQGESTILEYIWIDGSGLTMRSKARVVKQMIQTVEDVPEWNFDGSSC